MPSSVFAFSSESLSSEPVKLVQFSHGRLRQSDCGKLTWNSYRKRRTAALNTKVPDRKLLTASGNGLTYVGDNFGPQAIRSTDCDYYVAVRQKHSHKVQVLPAELYRMEPKVHEEVSPEELNSTQTWKEKKSDLTKEFGSGRSQRAVLKNERNKLNQDMVSDTARKMAKSSHTSQQAEQSPTVQDLTSEMSAIPPHNKDAKTPGDVYKLKDIISDALMGPLATLSQGFVNSTKDEIGKWRGEKTYPTFILDKLEVLSVREDARLFQCQCLMFLSCLIKTYSLKYTDIRKKYPFPQEWPESVKKHILGTFTFEAKQSDGKLRRSMPGPKKDLLLSHILVLCLKLSGFQLQLNCLIADLNIAQKKLTTHASALGCTVRSIRDPKDKSIPPVYQAELKVPLKLPEVKGKSSRKRIF